ncbi:outer membrane protein [Pseudoteredinibacter isoporae]|uniref:Opacity protein-like surface antigen n=1 Tax=Pseudoteredinibacter isoporae TaxID=570281 RepID=A0A7X0JU75_9GAMM|nr:outer membrane beta-barrel protein [Pseudoteredinibacter isoporae]MBB6521471.1 opacity protein-like surface antigen [Pseudoteredinibacter isoporae]NHO87025.1 porin family protein [Pseudoteredinibacter isoporae]NIB24522.1 porin family protein [Pseudoteredinibacter isoporae]
MKIKAPLALAISFTAISLSSTTVIAQQQDSFYLKGQIGVTFAEDENTRDEAAGRLRGIDVETAISSAVAVGYSFSQNYRIELEVAQRSGDLDGAVEDSPFAPIIGSQINSNFDSTSLMINAFYDHPLAKDWNLILGGGIGFSRNDVGAFEIDNLNPNVPNFIAPRGQQTEFAWNLGVGLAYKLSERSSLELMYRHIDLGEASSDPEQFDETLLGAPVATEAGADLWDAELNEISLGLRVHF